MRIKILLTAVWVTLLFSGLTAQNKPEEGFSDNLEFNIQLLKRYLSHGENWFFTDPLTEKRLAGLIHFIENEPIDTILLHLKRVHAADSIAIVWRETEKTPDSLSVPGYLSHRQLLRQLQSIDEEVTREFASRPVTVPIEIMAAALRDVELIPEGEGMQLFTDKIYRMPDSLQMLDAIPENMVQSARDFKRILRLDSIRSRLVEQKRMHYNDSLIQAARERVTNEYRSQLISERSGFLKSQKTDQVKQANFEALKIYNNKAIRSVNDSIRSAMVWLSDFADLIDNTTINLVNLSKTSEPLVLSNSGQFFTRVWLKNQQNDSLAVLIQNLDKRSIQMAIEDGVTFSRFKQQSVKDFDFRTLNQPSVSLDKLSKRYQAYTPWTIGGDGTMGFTQTYLSNWKKGGKSALSILVVAKGFANYSSEKFKWENSAEIRNGWVKPGDDKIQKTDDKVEFTSRVGVSAFKKWYYSAEADFETQFFDGFKYPNREKPISGFLAPGKFLFKIGMDYKPSKNFSLFISPLTSKTVFFHDTTRINKSNFGIKPGRKSYWEPGLHTDLKFTTKVMTGVTYETKYRMFLNYLRPFDHIDVEWENIVKMQVNSYINVQVMAHSIYDSKVLFDRLDKEGKPVLDASGAKIKEPKLQFKEFITIGFTYKINHRVVRAREIK